MTGDPWESIASHSLARLTELFEKPGRVDRFSLDVAQIHCDWSKTHLDEALLADFVRLAEQRGFAQRRDSLFAGDIVNPSEDRPAGHVAERGNGAAAAVEEADARRNRLRALADAVEAGAFGEVTAILHIGIGGSVLGPALAFDALGRAEPRMDVRFLSNIDGAAFDEAVSGLDPQTTLVVAVSKTFTTIETMMNLDAALDWLRQAGLSDPYGKVIAVTANPQAALEAGIDESRILSFSDSVGGRYSLWSAVGVSIALALGWQIFEEMLEGAAAMDRHFRFSAAAENGPLIAAFVDQLYARKLGAETRAVFAYDERLRLLAPFLQQLEMESNGKSVDLAGRPLAMPSAPITWGGTGTDAQHAVFQLLHQGTHLVPVEFVAVCEGASERPDHHRLLLLNAFAQGAALMQGRGGPDPNRCYPGNRPSTTILLDRLDPHSLGALLAFYEHRVFANAVLIGINPFDQFGVELGKQIANQLGEDGTNEAFDPSTRDLMERAGL